MSDLYLVGKQSVQDRDLLARLTGYFDTLRERLREGQGWFIFSVGGERGRRTVSFIADRLLEYQPMISYFLVPWRDFALNAYMQEVELASNLEQSSDAGSDEKLRQEYAIATRVFRDTYYVMSGCDVLVISELSPKHFHEIHFLDKVIEGRHSRHYPTILLSPRGLSELSADFDAIDPTKSYWSGLFKRMYNSSLIAV